MNDREIFRTNRVTSEHQSDDLSNRNLKPDKKRCYIFVASPFFIPCVP